MPRLAMSVCDDLECGAPARLVLAASLPEVTAPALLEVSSSAWLHRLEGQGTYARRCRRRPCPPAVVRACKRHRTWDNRTYLA